MAADERKKLPALVVTPEGYALVRSFARANDISISQAIRELLKESPRLIAYAQREGVDLGVMNVSEWGGRRSEADE